MAVNKYWENEKPQEMATGSFVIKSYRQAQKVQFYNWIEGRGYTGLSKGVTAHLDEMSTESIQNLRNHLVAEFDAVLTSRKAGMTVMKTREKRLPPGYRGEERYADPLGDRLDVTG